MEAPEPAFLPEEARVLQCLQLDAPDVLSAGYHSYHHWLYRTYYIPVQVNIVFRFPGCPVWVLSPVTQLVLLSLFPTGTLMMLPMVIRAS